MLNANPVVAGVTYLEGDLGSDSGPDYFEVTFQGGSETTLLTQFIINGDQDHNGVMSDGDMVFDVDANAPGTGGFHPFQFNAARSLGIAASDISSAVVSSDGLRLTVTLNNFKAGDRLAFTIDVDEVERDRMDKIASGVEFEQTLFQATFEDAHYSFTRHDLTTLHTFNEGGTQTQHSGIFYDEYDQMMAAGSTFAGATLNLYADNEQNAEDRSDGAIDVYDLTPKPVAISGHVYQDIDLDCVRDASEHGIEGVTLTLQAFNNATNKYETVATTTTDADGYYEFGTELGLMPGKYRLLETQPAGYLSVGAVPGTVEGNPSGTVVNWSGEPNILSEITIPLGGNRAENYDFCEVRPALISGHVWHDHDNDGLMDAGEEPIANVLIKITRMGSIPGQGDPFAGTAPIFVQTNANGFYQATGLPPGVYEIVEINNYPVGANPLAGFIDGKDSLGNVGGVVRGIVTNDRFSQIELGADDSGVQYNFGELKPVSISGYVSITTPDGDCLNPTDPNFRPIAGVTLKLFDQNGQLVETTTTDAQGHYSFQQLVPGTYSVIEVQPAAYLDGTEAAGTVGGVTVGAVTANDRISQIALQSGDQGVRYDFCEHEPASLCGYVWHDRNDDGIRGSGEEGIGNVVIELFDGTGAKVAQTTTDANGRYCFTDLAKGDYTIIEHQPNGFVDGKESLGQVNGKLVGNVLNDKFQQVAIKYGQAGDDYDFGEWKYGSIAGDVFADVNNNCVFEPAVGDHLLAGVTLQLFDASSHLVATTTTNAQGHYVFGNLRPGTYTVRELQPAGYLDGGDMLGTVGGVAVGMVANDEFRGIRIASADAGVDYDFCENVPAELSGHVWHDLDNDGTRDVGEIGIGNVRIELYDADGGLVASTTTDAQGAYAFKNLLTGQYKIKEIQPAGWTDGKESLGKVAGVWAGEVQQDQFCYIDLLGGQKGENYDFGEIKLSQISGYVHTDNNGNCVLDTAAGEKPLAGVTMQLLDGRGVVLASTQTNAEGFYQFDRLMPDLYAVRQLQPSGYFSVGQVVGKTASGAAGTGDNSVTNLISGIRIRSGDTLVQYNFCEQAPAKIQGRVWEDGPTFVTENGTLPDDYRSQRDGIYTPGVDQPIAGVKMTLWYYTDIEHGVLNPRPVTLADVLPEFYSYMAGQPSNTPLFVMTNANGEYSFGGLKAGNYIVLQAQPNGYADANEYVGTTTGFTYNSEVSAQLAPKILSDAFDPRQLLDAINAIQVTPGAFSAQNNFTEVRVMADRGNLPYYPPLPPPPPPTYGPLVTPPGALGLGLFGAQPLNVYTIPGISVAFGIDAGLPAEEYTWHLSVVDSGHPRGDDAIAQSRDSVWMNASFGDTYHWSRGDMNQASWSISTRDGGELAMQPNVAQFGMKDGFPLVGDWDGDGKDELGVFWNGYWFIDINGNRTWDNNDLVVKLGSGDDQPVVGDWDNDGKDDIGIFGPVWPRDEAAIPRNPGLPNPANATRIDMKNLPPHLRDATDGARVMRLTKLGTSRADVIDHVFRFGQFANVAVAGDWNGSGIRSIGVFRDGVWRLDTNGNGRWDADDLQCTFGTRRRYPCRRRLQRRWDRRDRRVPQRHLDHRHQQQPSAGRPRHGLPNGRCQRLSSGWRFRRRWNGRTRFVSSRCGNASRGLVIERKPALAVGSTRYTGWSSCWTGSIAS